MDKSRVCDLVTDAVVESLNYTDNAEKMARADFNELSALIAGSVERYRNDFVFRARVQSLVGRVMQAIGVAEKESDDALEQREALCQEQAKQIEELAAALAVKDEALDFVIHMPRSAEAIRRAAQALSIQPHAALVAKIKADAVREVVGRFVMIPSTQANAIHAYADRIEKGEV